ncbi:MAG: DAK2 domain-containing protein, partial [Chloroflexota bacterium]
GVMRPVEGTILTVVREGSEEAVDAAGKSDDLRFVLERVLQRCRQALERTPDLLPILKQAGVVDSGGQGLVYILEGMLRYLNGELADVVYKPDVPVGAPAQALAAPAGGLEFPYDVQFIILGSRLNVGDVRQRIDAMGDSTVVVGDEKAIKVHVHVKDPGQPLSFGAGLGRLSDVVVENMQMQMEEIIRGEMKEEEARTTTPDDSSFILPPSFLQPGQIGVVAVASGNGLTRIFRELNVDQIVNGGQTNNPSTEEIFQAVQDVPTDKVIILPNNKNIILAAEAARALSPKNVAVVPSRTIPQGISALFHLARDGDLESVAAQMTAACHQVATGEITRATRSVHLDGVKVKKGELIGLANGRLCASGKELPDVLAHTLAQMGVAERELLSVYYGQDVRPEEAQQVAGQVAELYPEMEVELLDGGQAHYYYILGAE